MNISVIQPYYREYKVSLMFTNCYKLVTKNKQIDFLNNKQSGLSSHISNRNSARSHM